MLNVRKGKYRKDRYVPLCDLLISCIKKHVVSENPNTYLFNGKSSTGQCIALTTRGVHWAVKEARAKSGIQKRITAHDLSRHFGILRHSYATHLLEMGIDIITLKDLLEEEDIKTTMIYLHVSKTGRTQAYSPLEKRT